MGRDPEWGERILARAKAEWTSFVREPKPPSLVDQSHRHLHVTYSYATDAGERGSGSFACPVTYDWPADLVRRVPADAAHALRVVRPEPCDCRLYRGAATEVIERAAVETPTPGEVPGAACRLAVRS